MVLLVAAAEATEFINILFTGLLPSVTIVGNTAALFSITPSKFSPFTKSSQVL